MYSHLHWMSENVGTTNLIHKRKHSARYESVVNWIFLHLWDAQDQLPPYLPYYIHSPLCNILQIPGCWIVGVYSHAYSIHGIHFASLRYLFQLTSLISYNRFRSLDVQILGVAYGPLIIGLQKKSIIWCQEVGPGTKNTLIKQTT